jgi:hypothetical protein
VIVVASSYSHHHEHRAVSFKVTVGAPCRRWLSSRATSSTRPTSLDLDPVASRRLLVARDYRCGWKIYIGQLRHAVDLKAKVSMSWLTIFSEISQRQAGVLAGKSGHVARCDRWIRSTLNLCGSNKTLSLVEIIYRAIASVGMMFEHCSIFSNNRVMMR